ncbi:MAG TPA: hypothetical protein VLK35_05850 [Methylomirabilota bacterium]|nr:hypothetical protein [Methylomirabilota bacterium]
MTVEEALLAVVGVIALVLLFFGLADALEGDPRAWLRGRRRPLTPRTAPRPAPPPAVRVMPRRRSDAPSTPPTDLRQAAARDAAGQATVIEWRDRVAALIRSRELDEARRLLEPALARDEVGRETAAFLLEVCSTTVARDLWRLRRALRRGGDDEAPLEGSLATTRLLLDAPVAQRLARKARRRGSARLWRGHLRLGLRRWRAGNFEPAVEALSRALEITGIAERRRRLGRDLLVRTLEDMAGQSLELIPQLLGDGDRAAGLAQAQRLLAHIRRARSEGISAEDLAVAASRARQLVDHIEQAPVP